jgi:hypothetical protein
MSLSCNGVEQHFQSSLTGVKGVTVLKRENCTLRLKTPFDKAENLILQKTFFGMVMPFRLDDTQIYSHDYIVVIFISPTW